MNTGSFTFIKIELRNWLELTISFNIIGLVLIIALINLLVHLVKIKNNSGRSGRKIKIEGFQFGIGDFTCTLTCSDKVQEIAYRLWVELNTRKIAIPIEENDVITEIYNSWYAAFISIRECLKEIPGNALDDASDLIDLTTKVLNEGLRPHLTRWQAKYRSWYELESKKTDEDPQTIQKKYPYYEELISDLKRTNSNMINFANELHRIAFSEKKLK